MCQNKGRSYTDRCRPTHNRANEDHDDGLPQQARDHPGEHGHRCYGDGARIHFQPTVMKNKPNRTSQKGRISLYLMTEIAFADHHTGEERSNRRRKAGQMSGECRTEREQQNGKQKEISRVRPGNPGKPGAENRLSNESCDTECHRRYSELAQRYHRFRPAAWLPSTENNEKWKDRKVLEEQDSQHETALLAADAAA
jgi:hypothetical protein